MANTESLETFLRKVAPSAELVKEAVEALAPFHDIAKKGRYPLEDWRALDVDLFVQGYDRISKNNCGYGLNPIALSARTGAGSASFFQKQKNVSDVPRIPTGNAAARPLKTFITECFIWLTGRSSPHPSLMRLVKNDAAEAFLNLTFGMSDAVQKTLKGTACEPYAETARAMQQTFMTVWLDRLHCNELVSWRSMNYALRKHRSLFPLGPHPSSADPDPARKRFWVIIA